MIPYLTQGKGIKTFLTHNLTPSLIESHRIQHFCNQLYDNEIHDMKLFVINQNEICISRDYDKAWHRDHFIHYQTNTSHSECLAKLRNLLRNYPKCITSIEMIISYIQLIRFSDIKDKKKVKGLLLFLGLFLLRDVDIVYEQTRQFRKNGLPWKGLRCKCVSWLRTFWEPLLYFLR